MRRFYLPVLLLVFISGSCRLDPPVYPEALLAAQNPGNSFQPSAKGSVWVYEIDYGSHKAENTFTSAGITKTIGTKTYDVYTGVSNGMAISDVFYSNKTGLYVKRQKLEGYTDYVDFYYLKEDASIGETWTYPVNETGTLDGLPARSLSRLIEKNVDIEVAGKKYTSVFHTQIELQAKLDEEYITFAIFDFYVAKGVGIVQTNTSIFGFEFYTYLKSYTGK